MAVALTLPRADAVTDALLEPVPALGADDLRRVAADLDRSLGALAGELPPGVRLVLDGFRLDSARRRPERCRQAEPGFTPDATSCRRAVGVAALARGLRTGAPYPAPAVAEVLAGAEEDARMAAQGMTHAGPWWSAYYCSLGDAGRAVVRAEATTWATQVWTALRFDRLSRPVVGCDDWRNVGDGTAMVLHGRAEVRAALEDRCVLVVVRAGVPDGAHRAELLFPALVRALAAPGQPLPGRVLGVWPACGQVRLVDVDAAALSACADDVVAAAGTWVDGLLERARV